jgi:cobalamin biosynthesis protein CbiD
MMAIQVKRGTEAVKGMGSRGRPAGMQAIDPALYQQIRQAVKELSQPRPTAGVS